jgi:TolB protein
MSGSTTGTIVYRLGPANRQRQFACSIDRARSSVSLRTVDAANTLNPALSPDGRQVALNRSVDGNADIWLLDLGRRVLSRFTSDPRPEIYPVWSPDGTRIVYAAVNGTRIGIQSVREDRYRER